jgi:hypothetical protein
VRADPILFALFAALLLPAAALVTRDLLRYFRPWSRLRDAWGPPDAHLFLGERPAEWPDWEVIG